MRSTCRLGVRYTDAHRNWITTLIDKGKKDDRVGSVLSCTAVLLTQYAQRYETNVPVRVLTRHRVPETGPLPAGGRRGRSPKTVPDYKTEKAIFENNFAVGRYQIKSLSSFCHSVYSPPNVVYRLQLLVTAMIKHHKNGQRPSGKRNNPRICPETVKRFVARRRRRERLQTG